MSKPFDGAISQFYEQNATEDVRDLIAQADGKTVFEGGLSLCCQAQAEDL